MKQRELFKLAPYGMLLAELFICGSGPLKRTLVHLHDSPTTLGFSIGNRSGRYVKTKGCSDRLSWEVLPYETDL